MKQENFQAQKKYLSTKKQLRVWVSMDKYNEFHKIVTANNSSIYAVINNFIDDYIKSYASKD